MTRGSKHEYMIRSCLTTLAARTFILVERPPSVRLPWRVKACCLLALILAGPPQGRAQQDGAISLDDLVQAGQQWAEENLDQSVLGALQEADQAKLQQLFRDLQGRLQGEHVIDLAPLKKTVDALLPLLEAHEETEPYAQWLRSRLDYLDVADQFRLTIPAPKPEPGQLPKPIPNPEPALERKVWQKRLEKRPLPTGASAWATRLKPFFLAERIPEELVWLAEVESSFQPGARSPVGAAGLFQLMPPTAKSLGLSLRPDDERLQPEKSAGAAAKYLRYLYGRFKDWPLALAAYNAGEGRVQGLLEKRKSRTFDEIATRLPAETQMYVPKMNAMLLRREGIPLDKLPPPRS